MSGTDTRAARLARRAFDRASLSFDDAAVVHRELRDRLLERLAVIKQAPQVILDLGAGTGHASQKLKRQFPSSQVIALDFSAGMLTRARRQTRWWRSFHRVCADATAIPLTDQSVNWVISNAMLQHCTPPDAIFREVRRVLKPGGLFCFSTFGPDTLKELRAAWIVAGHTPPASPLLDMHDIGDALVRAGFGEPVLDIERLTVTYREVGTLFSDLRATGGTWPTPAACHLGHRGRIESIRRAYELTRRDLNIPLSVEAVFGQAWRPSTSTEHREQGDRGEVRVPLTALRRRR